MHTNALFEAALGLSAPWKVISIEFEQGAPASRGQLEIRLDFERGGQLPCPECGALCKAHDTDEQTWRHLDFFEHTCHLVARVPRVGCQEHGVLKVHVPWARPGSGFTLLFEALVMALAPEMPMAALARLVREHDTRLWRIVKWHVADARSRVDMSDVDQLVVDETSQAKRKSFVSIFLEPKRYDDEGSLERAARVLYVAKSKSKQVFHEFAQDLIEHGGHPWSIREVCMDMCAPYMQGVAETMPRASITFDRFHVMKMVNAAVDDARRREVKTRPELKRTRLDWLLSPSRLSTRRRERVESLSQRNLLTAKAYQMRLTLAELWDHASVARARRHLRSWCAWVKRATKPPEDDGAVWVLERMRRVAQSVREHEDGILRYVASRLTSGVIEGVNSLAQAARARARGYRNVETFKTMIYLIAGRLQFDLQPATHSR